MQAKCPVSPGSARARHRLSRLHGDRAAGHVGGRSAVTRARRSNYRCGRSPQKRMPAPREKGSQEGSPSPSAGFTQLTRPRLPGTPGQGLSQRHPCSGAGPRGRGRSSAKMLKWKQVRFSMATSKNWVSSGCEEASAPRSFYKSNPGRKGQRAVGTGGEQGHPEPWAPRTPGAEPQPPPSATGCSGVPQPCSGSGGGRAPGRRAVGRLGGGTSAPAPPGASASIGAAMLHGGSVLSLRHGTGARPPLRGHRLCPAPRQLCPGTASSLSFSATRSQAPFLCTAAASLALLGCRCSFIAYFGSRAG